MTTDPASAPPQPHQRSEQTPEQRSEQRPEQRTEQRTEQRPDQRSDQRLEQRPDQRTEQRSEQRLEQQQDQRSAQQPGHNAPQHLAQDSTRERAHESAQRQAGRLEDEWQAVQFEFVDDPKAAVRKADALVQRAIEELTSRHRTLSQQWQGEGKHETEDLRLALHRYRELFKSLVAVK